MDQRRRRLVLLPGAPLLDAQQAGSLHSVFDVLEGEEAARAIASGLRPDDIVVRPPDAEASSGNGGAKDTSDGPTLAAIDAIGQDMLHIAPEELATLSTVDRLKRLETHIRSAMRDHLHFEHFEVRLLNTKTRQLELVIAVGLKPLGVGLSLFATPEENGISGYVASTGQPYICRDASADPRFLPGLENAASSLTVPLKLHDNVIGVLNVESTRAGAFNEVDLHRTERLALYIAIAMHMLNLLVIERFTTRKQTADVLAEEMASYLDDVERTLKGVQEVGELSAAQREAYERIQAALDRSRAAVKQCIAGPQSLLGLEKTLQECAANPHLRGRRVLVVDDDDTIRSTIGAVLERAGCAVVTCPSGRGALEQMNRLDREDEPPDVLISDVKLPDLNGYEIFRTARERYRNIPVILMTGFGYDPHHSIVRASQEGLQSILFKPFKANQLLDEVVRALSSNSQS